MSPEQRLDELTELIEFLEDCPERTEQQEATLAALKVERDNLEAEMAWKPSS